MNKRGWIKIVEAFISVLILIGIILLIISKNNPIKEDISSRIYDSENSILREIENNNAFREMIVEYSGTLPLEWEDFETSGLEDIKNKIQKRTPNYLECFARLCEPEDSCNPKNLGEKDVYAKSVLISATTELYDPKQLKIFCKIR